jgi:hypothetical protein
MTFMRFATVLVSICTLHSVKAARAAEFTPLFSGDGEPKGWSVRAWADLKDPAPKGAVWKVKDGILHGSDPRGTWLVSDRIYGDFVLDFEWKLGEQGNSGFGIRFPDAGDPAFDGLEVQMCDPRYKQISDPPEKLTGSLYKALAPRKQVYKPIEWNHYVITCIGSKIKVVLNDEVVQDLDLKDHAEPLERHDGSAAPPLKDRPRKGHIGFQELSRGNGHVQIRKAKIKVLDGAR